MLTADSRWLKQKFSKKWRKTKEDNIDEKEIEKQLKLTLENLKKQETVSNVAPVSVPKDNTSNYKRILDTFKLVIKNIVKIEIANLPVF